jgi:ATP sulfurylase
MAITYENVIYDRVIENLHSIIADEFSIPIYFDVHEGNQSFLITPVSDELEDSLTSGQTRHCTVEISYQLTSSGNYTKNSVKQVSEIAERLKRLLYNNRNYAVSGTTKFFNGIVNGINYERDEDNEELLRSILSFTCTTMELV